MFLEEILVSENILQSINDNLENLFMLIPELRMMVGFEHRHPHHHLDVWNHTLYALSLSPNDFEVRLVLLLHDIGKPYCFIEGEIRNFRNHPIVSSEMSRIILKRLRYDENFVEKICYLIKYHDIPIRNEKILMDRDLEYKRYLVQYCDCYAHHPLKLEKRIRYLKKVNDMFNDVDDKS